MTLQLFTALWLGSLAILWAFLLLGSYRPGQEVRRMRWLRMASSATLTVAAWSSVLLIPDSGLRAVAWLIAAGMTCGLLGDLLLAGVIPAGGGLIPGMAGFGVGHVLYIAAGLVWGGHAGLTDPWSRTVPWLAWLALAAGAWYALIYRGQKVTVVHWLALPYALLLASTAGVANGLALQAPRLLPLAFGGVLFLISDFLIALCELTPRGRRWMRSGVWITYGPAQALIVYSVWLATI